MMSVRESAVIEVLFAMVWIVAALVTRKTLWVGIRPTVIRMVSRQTDPGSYWGGLLIPVVIAVGCAGMAVFPGVAFLRPYLE
jgi:hypothetical protein